MCTAVSFKTNSHYFGRNLDLELSYGEKAVIVPRNFVFNLADCKK
ncbi:linear amide C-N hydrolase [Ligilactobacillus animalis]